MKPPRKLTDEQVAQIRAACHPKPAYGIQKVLAIDFGVSRQLICQILKGTRRKPAYQ